VIPLASTLRERSGWAPALALALFALGLAPGVGLAEQNASVSDRVSRLEAEVANLKVMVVTLESLLRSTPGATLPQESAGNAATASHQDDLVSRVAALETQIGALTSEIDQIDKQMSALEARLSAVPPSAPQTQVPQAEVPQAQVPAALPNKDNAGTDTGDLSKPRWYGPRSDTGAASGEGGPRQILPQGDGSTGSIEQGKGP
jgi:cell division protein FtsB